MPDQRVLYRWFGFLNLGGGLRMRSRHLYRKLCISKAKFCHFFTLMIKYVCQLARYTVRPFRRLARLPNGAMKTMDSSCDMKCETEIKEVAGKDGQTECETASSDSDLSQHEPPSETELNKKYMTRTSIAALVESESAQVNTSDSDSSSVKNSVTSDCNLQSAAAASTKACVLQGHVETKRIPGKESIGTRDVQHQQAAFFSLWSKEPRTREQIVKEEKEKYLKMPLPEKRKLYACGDTYVVLEEIPTWPDYLKNDQLKRKYPKDSDIVQYMHSVSYEANNEINEKVSVWRGDITTLEIDAIVNAANCTLLGGGGVDGAIHRAAGSALLAECRTLKGCDTGDAKATGGYKLPAKYVIHTVGPQGEYSRALRNCYSRCIQEMEQRSLKTIAFPCISTGIYGYPNEKAVHVALRTVRQWLDKLSSQKKLASVERVIFCVFLDVDMRLYESWMQLYFPMVPTGAETKPNNEEAGSTGISDTNGLQSVLKSESNSELTQTSVVKEEGEREAADDNEQAEPSVRSPDPDTSPSGPSERSAAKDISLNDDVTDDTKGLDQKPCLECEEPSTASQSSSDEACQGKNESKISLGKRQLSEHTVRDSTDSDSKTSSDKRPRDDDELVSGDSVADAGRS